MGEAARGEGLGGSLRGIVATLLSMLVTRVELASAELEQARDHIVSSLALLLVAAVFLFMALLAASLLVAVVFWETHRIAALAGLALGYALIGALLGLAARRRLKSTPPMLAATVAEFRRDAESLRGGTPRAAPPSPAEAP